jgi:hypothetical protein
MINSLFICLLRTHHDLDPSAELIANPSIMPAQFKVLP